MPFDKNSGHFSFAPQSRSVAPPRIARGPAAYETAEVLLLQGAMHKITLSQKFNKDKKSILNYISLILYPNLQENTNLTRYFLKDIFK